MVNTTKQLIFLITWGAPDYKNYLNRFSGYFNFMIPINNNKFCSYSVLSYTKITNSQSHSIGSYLAGLWEGDGHLYLPKVIDSNGKTTYPYLAITFVWCPALALRSEEQRFTSYK